MAFLVLEQESRQYRISAGVPAYANDPPHRPHASWNWDGAALTVTSGNLGFFPLCILQENGRYGVATSLPELLPFARSMAIDEPAVAAFLHVGFYLGDDTPLQAIRSFPPVDWLSFEAGAVTLGPGFHQPEPTTMSRAQIKKTYAELVAAAVADSRPSFDIAMSHRSEICSLRSSPGTNGPTSAPTNSHGPAVWRTTSIRTASQFMTA